MPVQGNASIERMCQLAQVSRAGFYRFLQDKTPVEEDMELRSAIQQIVLEHRRRYGYRRVSAELRRRGMLANHKRVARIMREDLLAVQPRQFVVTTDSTHELEVYLNLAYRMKLTGIGANAHEPTGDSGIARGHRKTATTARSDSSLGSRSAICLRRCSHPGTASDDPEHESAGEPLRQCQLRELHEDAEAGRNLRERV
jgi:hypothetical protein